MSTFYLLPARPVFLESLEQFLQNWLPGSRILAEAGLEAVHLLQLELEERAEAFLVFREDLPDDGDIEPALSDGFGAEPGDRVYEIRLSRPGVLEATVWTVGGVPAGERINTIRASSETQTIADAPCTTATIPGSSFNKNWV